ncbi:MAG TPA: DsbE family thiol:disulfide interchange protein [Cellvibrio sp.]|jgi:cytochrome c biogenesis protein CcmG/thiol:disulfide interchange protein DsbE|nr:DsbE family thiol:disulfide interchange protein [Cellvibrio sp.]
MVSQRLKLFIPLIVFVVLAVLFWRGLSLDPNAMPSALIGKPVPAFSLPMLENTDRMVDQDIFKGKVSLLNVWATWCPTCYAEHGFLVTLAEQGVPIYGVNYKDDVPAAQKWLKELHNPYVLSVVDADGRLGVNLGVFGAPETYVIDKEGVIRYKHIGVVDEKVWTQTLQPLMAKLQ